MMQSHLLHIKVLKDGLTLEAFVIQEHITDIALFGHMAPINAIFTILPGQSNARPQIGLF